MIINEIGEIENFEQRFTIKGTIYENDATIINEGKAPVTPVIDEKTKNILIKKTVDRINGRKRTLTRRRYRLRIMTTGYSRKSGNVCASSPR
jgi:hypothetical protein